MAENVTKLPAKREEMESSFAILVLALGGRSVGRSLLHRCSDGN